jgi:hypothetical protein
LNLERSLTLPLTRIFLTPTGAHRADPGFASGRFSVDQRVAALSFLSGMADLEIAKLSSQFEIDAALGRGRALTTLPSRGASN